MHTILLKINSQQQREIESILSFASLDEDINIVAFKEDAEAFLASNKEFYKISSVKGSEASPTTEKYNLTKIDSDSSTFTLFIDQINELEEEFLYPPKKKNDSFITRYEGFNHVSCKTHKIQSIFWDVQNQDWLYVDTDCSSIGDVSLDDKVVSCLASQDKKNTISIQKIISNILSSNEDFLEKDVLKRIKKLERKVSREENKIAEMSKTHKGNESKMTYHGGFDFGYVKGKISGMENNIDDLVNIFNILMKKSLGIDNAYELKIDEPVIPSSLINDSTIEINELAKPNL